MKIKMLALLLLLSSAASARYDQTNYDLTHYGSFQINPTTDVNEPLHNPTIEEFNQRLKDEQVARQNNMYMSSDVLTVDTRDQEACNRIKTQLMNVHRLNADNDDFCERNEESPFTTIMLVNENQKPRKFRQLEDKEKELLKQTRNFVGAGTAFIGFLWMLPEEITKWDKNEIGGLGDKYWENVKAGPVVDKDDWAINYIGHPVSGAAYYVVARHAGFSKKQSFGYSVFMSTVFWEYGLEAAAEIPSIQDLIITPIVGSIMGEAFFKWSKEIKKNKGVLWGSKRAGAVALGLLNPAGWSLQKINSIFESKLIKSSDTSFIIGGNRFENSEGEVEAFAPDMMGIKIEWKFK